MMNIDLDNGWRLGVRFEYWQNFFGDVWYFGKSRMSEAPRVAVVAKVSVRDPEGKWLDIGEGMSIKNPVDQFNKQLGRRISLSRALDAVFSGNKEMRSLVWNEYFKTHRDALENINA